MTMGQLRQPPALVTVQYAQIHLRAANAIAGTMLIQVQAVRVVGQLAIVVHVHW